MALFRDALMPNGLGLSKDLIQSDSGEVVFDENSSVSLHLFTQLLSVARRRVTRERRDRRNLSFLNK
jgi:hypothetical protein